MDYTKETLLEALDKATATLYDDGATFTLQDMLDSIASDFGQETYNLDTVLAEVTPFGIIESTGGGGGDYYKMFVYYGGEKGDSVIIDADYSPHDDAEAFVDYVLKQWGYCLANYGSCSK